MSSTTTPIVKPLLPPEIEELHASVVAAGQETYTDPATGYMVMSGLYHTRRGYCCGNVCRHCPYNSMNVGKKKVDWLMADGTKYTAKKAAALTRLAKGDEEGGESPGKKEKDEDEDDNNDGGAGSDGSGSSSSSGTGGSCSSSGSRTIAAEATKAFVKMTTATEITTTSLPNGGSAQILPGTGPLPGASGGCVLASLLMVRPAALWHVGGIGPRINDGAAAAVLPSQALWMGGRSWAMALRQMSGTFRSARFGGGLALAFMLLHE